MERSAWERLTDDERYTLVDGILIEHQRFQSLLEEINQYARIGLSSKLYEPPCLAIVGDTGAGKSTLVRTWVNRAPCRETPTATIIPYLHIIIPANAGIKAAAATILRGLHDPNPSRGTEWNMTLRVYRLLAECQVQVLFVDEVQHMINKDDKQKVAYRVADFFKTIMLETHIPMVLVGHHDAVKTVFDSNNQLERRFGTPRVLEPFVWDRAQPDTTIHEFCELMEGIDEALPLDAFGLGKKDTAFRFFYATNGYLGWIMHIICHAAYEAIRNRVPAITLDMLAGAYQRRIAGTTMGFGKDNPFTNTFKV